MKPAIPPWALAGAKVLLAVLIIIYVAAIGVICLWQFTQGRSGLEIGAVAFSLLYVVKTIGSFAGQNVPDVSPSAIAGNALGGTKLTKVMPGSDTNKLPRGYGPTDNSTDTNRKAMYILQRAIDDENIPAETRVNAAVAWIQQDGATVEYGEDQ